MVSKYRNGKSDVWVTNLQFRNQIIPRGMCIGQAEPLNEGHLCVISDTSGCLDDQQETSESQMNCSLMMSPELSDEQRNKLSELLRKFSGLFTKTDKSTAAKTNVKHRIFTGDHAQSTNEPTESRRLKDASFMKRFRKCLMKVSSNPLKVLGHHPLCLRFIKGFCYLAEPLQSLLKSGVEFHWGPEEVEAFNSLKKALTSDPVFGMYDERASTEIHTDASGYGIGAVLVQIQNNVEKVIAYASRTLTKAEKNYSTTERECLAIVWATNKFRPYIFGKHFTVVTDHHSLCWLMNLKDPSGRLARWALRLQEHDFDVKYKTGKKHSDADALSRNPVEEETETKFQSLDKSAGAGIRTRDLRKFPKSAHGNKWIIVCTDYSTRYAITKALPTAEVDEIAKFLLEEIVLRHGAPRVIITDRGAVFRSRLVSSLVDLCNIDHRFTTAYHPQTNGLTERFNKTLADMLSMYVDVEQKNWDEILPFVTFAYNTAKQETTGFTPFYLLHGREAETTLDTILPFCPNDFDDNNITKIAARAEESRQLARVHTLRSSRQRSSTLRFQTPKWYLYAPGDLVWVYTPYKILILLHEKENPREIVHVLRMKPYHDPAEQIETEDIPPKESYKGPITRSRIKTLEQNDSGALSSFSREQCHTHNLLQVPIAELAERWTELPQVSDESRSFFRVHTGYFSNIPKCIKAEFIASWACSQSSVVSSSKR
ncbi:retrovirus-related Pol polyprotein from transposon 17.6 [Trichonephila clavipes]|nr:retrovirus-related Pol polyprotein from transposon 17.6 [Trichonephila clavipes]